MHKRLAVIGFLFLLAACGGPPATEIVVPTESDESSSADLSNDDVLYTEYSDRLVGQGESSVLFFSKPTDPFSMKSDAVIRATYGSGAALVSTYRLDFQTSTGARLKYGVLVEDTFVLVDSTGARVANFVHPPADVIGTILRGRLPSPEAKL